MKATCSVGVIKGHPAIKCFLCGAVSFNQNDVANRYCGACHLSHDVVAEARKALHAAQTGALAGHDCSEWRTARDACAVCGTKLDPKDSERSVTPSTR